MRRQWPLTHFGLKNQKWAITFSSRYCSGAGEIFVDLTLAGRQAVVGVCTTQRILSFFGMVQHC